jgi:hypothetical protein
VLLAARRYSIKQGLKEAKLPGSIQELVPAFLPDVPIDPFDGQPMRFRVRDGAVTVWSVGKDEVDNDGRTNENFVEPDIALEMELTR